MQRPLRWRSAKLNSVRGVRGAADVGRVAEFNEFAAEASTELFGVRTFNALCA
jgi:hypothetical protein